MTSDATRRRLQVLDLRVRLERLAARAFDRLCRPARPCRQSRIKQRLLFLVGFVEPDRQAEAHRLARLGGHVYARTSDVLHGRTNALDLTDALLDEWRAVVVRLERLLPARPDGDPAG